MSKHRKSALITHNSVSKDQHATVLQGTPDPIMPGCFRVLKPQTCLAAAIRPLARPCTGISHPLRGHKASKATNISCSVQELHPAGGPGALPASPQGCEGLRDARQGRRRPGLVARHPGRHPADLQGSFSNSLSATLKDLSPYQSDCEGKEITCCLYFETLGTKNPNVGLTQYLKTV